MLRRGLSFLLENALSEPGVSRESGSRGEVEAQTARPGQGKAADGFPENGVQEAEGGIKKTCPQAAARRRQTGQAHSETQIGGEAKVQGQEDPEGRAQGNRPEGRAATTSR